VSSNVIFEFGSVPLNCVGMAATWRRPREQSTRWAPAVVVMAASTTDEGVYTPAADVMIGGKEALLALRSAIDEALKEQS